MTMSASPIEVVGQWLQNLLDPDVVNSVVAPDATYVSLNTEDAELNKIMPWAGTSHGPQAFLENRCPRHILIDEQNAQCPFTHEGGSATAVPRPWRGE